jgi:hypothetical protein
MKTKLQFMPGGAVECPSCCRIDRWNLVDGDTIPLMGNEIPGGIKPVAGGLVLSSGGYCFLASVNFCACQNCDANFYLVNLEVLNNPKVSVAYANKYFWHNGRRTEPRGERFTVEPFPPVPGVPPCWLMERTKTSAGTFDQHYLGPFIPDEDLEGQNGVASCRGGKPWEKAAWLIARVWPFITGYADDDEIPF